MARQMNTSQARQVDPVLTEHAHGYQHPERVGHHLFPTVFVGQRGGTIIEFDKRSFRLYNTRRSPGSATKRIQIGYEGGQYSLNDHSLEALVPDEIDQEAEAGPGIDAQQEGVELVWDTMSLEVEVEQAELARDPDNYDTNHKVTLSGTDQWDQSGEEANLIKQVTDYSGAIRGSIGVRPNTLVLGPDAFDAARHNTHVLDRTKYTSADSITEEVLARLLQLDNVYVGDAVYAESAGGEFTDVWGADGVLGYVPRNATSRRRPSYAYTYTLRNHPIVRTGYRDENAQSWVHPMNYVRQALLTGKGAGFLIQSIVS